MSSFFVHKHISAGYANLKIFNNSDEELSVSFDDSAGAMLHRSRVSMARFSGPKMSDMIGEEKFHPTAEEFLKMLAAHLGFDVVPKKD